jgi:outer membrane receptor protein involved in Fe transport
VASVRGENRSVQEEDKTGYLMANFDQDVGDWRLRGDAGVRYVETKQTSTFYTNVPTTVNASGFVQTTVERTYNDTLPSMNLVAEPTDKLLIRFSAAKVMARPALGNLAAATTVSVAGGSRSVSTGNANLDPYRAKTADFSVEWYPKPGVILSAGLFYKKISTYVQTITNVAPYSSTGLPVSLLDGTGVNANDDFAITNVINTPGGPLKGLELNYQQPLDFLPDAFRASASWPTTPMSTPTSTTSPPRRPGPDHQRPAAEPVEERLQRHALLRARQGAGPHLGELSRQVPDRRARPLQPGCPGQPVHHVPGRLGLVQGQRPAVVQRRRPEPDQREGHLVHRLQDPAFRELSDRRPPVLRGVRYTY